MKVKLKNNELHVTIPLESEFRRTRKGDSLIVADTSNFIQTDVMINNRPVGIMLKAVIASW